MTLKEIVIPNQFEGKKTFKLRITMRVRADATIKGNNEDEAWEKAEKLAQLQELEHEDIDDMIDMEVDDIEEVKK